MPLAKERELIPVSSQAHKHLRNLVAAMKRNGIPTNGTVIVSQAIMSIPIPAAPAEEKPRRARARKAAAV